MMRFEATTDTPSRGHMSTRKRDNRMLSVAVRTPYVQERNEAPLSHLPLQHDINKTRDRWRFFYGGIN